MPLIITNFGLRISYIVKWASAKNDSAMHLGQLPINQKNHHNGRQYGLALIEVLLSVSLSSAMFLLLLQLKVIVKKCSFTVSNCIMLIAY